MVNKKITNKYTSLAAVIVLATVFFIATSYFNFKTQDRDFMKWASPDETANYVFTKLYSESGKLVLFEKYNLYAGDIIHPRSMRSDLGEIKPVSFLGIILIYGKIAGIFGQKIIPYLTPFFASIGIVVFYLFIKKIFGRVNALLSATILALFPPYIYYTVRSMFHNVLFTVLLLAGLYFVLLILSKTGKLSKGSSWSLKIDSIKTALNQWRLVDWRGLIYAMLAGLFIGLSIITRTSELIWIAPMLFLAFVFNIKKVGIVKIIIFISFMFFAVLPAFYYNKVLHGGFFNTGYTEMNQSLENIAKAGSDIIKTTVGGEFLFIKDLINQIFDNIFHFGFNPKKSLEAFFDYFINMFPWIFWTAALGVLMYFGKIIKKRKKRKIKHKQLVYLAAYLPVFLILIFYYGSWEFYDNPDVSARTIGNSYTRYWLPVYIGLLPFTSFFIMHATRIMGGLASGHKNSTGTTINKKFFYTNLRLLVIFIIAFASIRFVLWNSNEGLYYLKERQSASRTEWEQVLELTEDNSVIITRYHDKLFFPERKVIVGLFDDTNMVAGYAVLAEHIPVYYYNFTLPDKDMDYLNTRRLYEAGLNINKVEQITEDMSLYKLYLRADTITEAAVRDEFDKSIFNK